MSNQLGNYEIKLKHFETPTSFHFYYEKDSKNKRHESIQKAISQCHATKRNDGPKFVPEVGSIVGFYYMKWSSFVRVKIMSREQNGFFRFFLVDHGHFHSSKEIERFTSIPEQLQLEASVIRYGHCGLKPSEKVMDQATMEMVTRPVRYWSDKAVSFIKGIDMTSNTFKFFFKFYKILPDGAHFGDMIAKNSHKTINVSQYLIAEGLAIRDPELTPSVLTVKEMPVANFEKIYTTLFPEPEETKPAKKSNKQPIMLASGVDGSFVNKRDNRPSLELNLRTQSVVKPKSAAVSSPSDIIVYGDRLVPPIPSVELAPFTESIKASLKNTTLSKTQQHSWAQIHQKLSLLIVGRKQDDFMSSFYLPPIINRIETKRDEISAGKGPVVVIVTKLASSVEKIVKLCLKLSSSLSVVYVSGRIDKKVELMNGCDVFVTTPAAFGRQLEGISFEIFDSDRIKCLVLDGVDGMIQPFQSEISTIIRKCTNRSVKAQTDFQMVITSSAWIKGLKAKLMRSVPSEDVVVCFENFFEAAASAGCDLSLEICSSLDQKFIKLLQSLKQATSKSIRTAIIVNDDETLKYLIDQFKNTVIDFTAADNATVVDAKAKWLQENKGNFSILITNDLVLDEMQLKNVENLIHFAVPRNWNQFERRFNVLIDQFYKKFRNKAESCCVASKIFLDNDNEGIFTRLISFMQKRNLLKDPEVYKDTLKAIKLHQENLKCHQNVTICNNIWMFGDCKTILCCQRHILAESDKPPSYLPTESLLKFKVVSVKSPVRFVIKMLEHKVGNKWISRSEENQQVEILQNDLQQYFSSSENRKPAKVEVDELYALMKDDKWYRCRVNEITTNQAIATVNLIDEGRIVPCVLSKLMDMPKTFKDVPPLVVELQILDLIPNDREEKWDSETKIVSEMMKEISNECSYTCKIEFAIRNILFANSFDAIDESGEFVLRLKSKLLKEKICSDDESMGSKLRLLAGLKVKSTEIKTESKEVATKESQSVVVPVVKTLEIPKIPAISKESWKTLSWGSTYNVHVGLFNNPDSFLIVLDTEDNKIVQNSLKEIENYAEKVPLDDVYVGAVCAVDGAKVRRGKVVEIFEDSIEVLLVDSAEMIKCKKVELLHLPNEFISKLSFQTVHCRLTGLCPRFNMKSWAPMQRNLIMNLVKSHEKLKMHVLKANESFDELKQLGLKSYEVILTNPETDSCIASIAVANKFADSCDKVNQSDANQDSGHVSEVDEQPSLDFLMHMMTGGDSSDDDFSDLKPLPKAKEPEKSLEVQRFENLSLVAKSGIQSQLKFIHKHPRIEWRQNDVLVFLLISAIDCEDYGLVIEDLSVDIAIKYRGNDYEKTVLQLYAPIVVKMSSHERRGLNIVVRLAKKSLCDEWPRLMETTENTQFIKFSNEKVLQQTPSATSYQGIVPDLYESEEEFKMSDDDEVDKILLN